jgi:ABC-2 type transport system ATP-binding protein
MIKVDNLTRAYGNFLAVNNVSFTIPDGEIVGLLGHNGAGKTTVMRMLSGYLEPGSGSIEIAAMDLSVNRSAVQATLGYLPENLPIYPEMSVADYLDYAAHLKGLSGNACCDSVRRVVKATDIGAKLLAPIATLSRGYKQRVGVSQALLGNPKVLILDEPTNGLDPTQTQQMRTLIKTIAQQATVILSTHIMQEVDALCDRALIMRNGELAVDAQLEALRESHQLLLSTDIAPEQAHPLLRAMAGVTTVSDIPGSFSQHRYRLRLQTEADLAATSAAIAKVLVEGGHALYELAVEQRDLENVFREVNEKEGISHAA